MFSRMLKLPEDGARRYDLSSLEIAVHAAAPCPVPVKEQMIDWWGPIIHEYYGATEGLGFTACDTRGVAGAPRHGRQGRCWASCTCSTTTCTELPDGPARRRSGSRPRRRSSTSTIRSETQATSLGRRHDDARSATSATSTTTASCTSPTASTFMIISGGVNIYPQESENLLITHPQGRRRGGVRRAQRGSRRGGQGGGAADARRGADARVRERADRVLPRAPAAHEVPAIGRLHGRSCRGCPPASSTSARCGMRSGSATPAASPIQGAAPRDALAESQRPRRSTRKRASNAMGAAGFARNSGECRCWGPARVLSSPVRAPTIYDSGVCLARRGLMSLDLRLPPHGLTYRRKKWQAKQKHC